jgi:aspartate ammonia-lyase
MQNFRTEHDLLGQREVPNQFYYGIRTLRAVENYQNTGIPISHYPHLISPESMTHPRYLNREL